MARAGGGIEMNCDCNLGGPCGGSCGGIVHSGGTIGKTYGGAVRGLVCGVGISGDLSTDLLQGCGEPAKIPARLSMAPDTNNVEGMLENKIGRAHV